MNSKTTTPGISTNQLHTGWFTGGCFWTSDAIFRHILGVQRVVSGYLWCKGGLPIQQSADRHLVERIEAVEVFWDPEIVSAESLVKVLAHTVSPSLGAWGEYLDEMSGLRSAALFSKEEDAQQGQKAIDEMRLKADEENIPFFTQIGHMTPDFVPAKQSDQEFFLNRPGDGYCVSLIAPKLERLRQSIGHLMAPQPLRSEGSTA